MGTAKHMSTALLVAVKTNSHVKGKGSPYSIKERRVPELIVALGSQPAGDVSQTLQ